jgi:AcrR family transcriptional regulator
VAEVREVRKVRSKTRDRILDAAFDMFLEVGVQGTTITDIERRVGLTPGTGSFYRHFRSKEDLLAAVLEREIERRIAEVRAAHEAESLPTDPREARIAEAERVLADIRRFDALFQLYSIEGTHNAEVRRAVVAAVHQQGSLLGEWILDPRRLVALTSLFGFHSFARANDELFTPQMQRRYLEELVDLTNFDPPGLPG